MALVLSACNPFQICRIVVGFVAVFVVDLCYAVGVLKKMFRYQTVRCERFANTVPTKSNSVIAFVGITAL